MGAEYHSGFKGKSWNPEILKAEMGEETKGYWPRTTDHQKAEIGKAETAHGPIRKWPMTYRQ
jgi:hypothetical protein